MTERTHTVPGPWFEPYDHYDQATRSWVRVEPEAPPPARPAEPEPVRLGEGRVPAELLARFVGRGQS